MVKRTMLTSEIIEKLTEKIRSISEEQDANAAVAIILKPTAKDTEILLVKRTKRSSDTWSGQMALPGGKHEVKDLNLKETVSRETLEETCIDLNRCVFLGTLKAVRSRPRPELLVLPFVVQLKYDPEICLSENELDEYLWVPFEILKKSSNIVRVGSSMKSAFVLGHAVVWGMTYQILTDFIEIVESIKKGNFKI